MVFIKDNPILCDDELPEIISAMEVNHTRIHGVSDCSPEPEMQETPIVNPVYATLTNINTPPPPPQVPIVHFGIADNQIRNPTNMEPVLEVKVLPLQPVTSLVEQPVTLEKSANLVVEKAATDNATP